MRERRWRPGWPLDLGTTLGPLVHGRGDPTILLTRTDAWRATRTPEGPATLHCTLEGREVLARAWGPGADWVLEGLPVALGVGDDPAGFAADAHPLVARAFRRFGPGWRVLRTDRVLESLVPAILEQRVTGQQAVSAWARLVRDHGEPAPGPGPGRGAAGGGRPLMVAPDGDGWARVPSWAWHRAGVDPGRASTVVRAAGRAEALERLADAPRTAAAALASIRGIGPWTAAEVAVRAWGDVDAVSFGDYHLARTVVHALTGRRDGTDAEMADLLAPWAGQRARAVRMIELYCGPMPRRAPRAAIADHRER